MACKKEQAAKDKADDRNQKAFDKRMEAKRNIEAAKSKRLDGILEAGEGMFSSNPAKVARGAKNAGEANKRVTQAEADYEKSSSDESKSAADYLEADRALKKCLEEDKDNKRKPKPSHRLVLELEFDITEDSGNLKTIAQGHVVFTAQLLTLFSNGWTGEKTALSTDSKATLAGSFRAIETPSPPSSGPPDPRARDLMRGGGRPRPPFDCTEKWQGTFKWTSSGRIKDASTRLLELSGHSSAEKLASNRSCKAIDEFPDGEFENVLYDVLRQAPDAGLLLVNLPEQGRNTQKVQLGGATWTIQVDKI